MEARIESKRADSIEIRLTIPMSSSMLEGEEIIQEAVNLVGSIASAELLERFDTDGSPIKIGNRKLTSKGKLAKTYQSPFGKIVVARHIYQGSDGGVIYCPLERAARIVGSATPRFSKQIASKYALMGAAQVSFDMADNHGRQVSRCMIQRLADTVGSAIGEKQEDWEYVDDVSVQEAVASMSIGIDGTCLLMSDDGWRETMVGTIGLYDEEGNRLHTTYVGAPPEYGKEGFYSTMVREIALAANRHPNATRVALADGARCNWSFLEQYTSRQTIDFWHVTEYINKAAGVLFGRKESEKREWTQDACHKLKHNKTGPKAVATDIRRRAKKVKSLSKRKVLASVLSYFRHNLKRMNYAMNLKENLPIGSGVTEAGCKILVKQRMCQSGMRWKEQGAAIVLSLRSMLLTGSRWNQFWSKVSQYGFPVMG